MKSFAVHYMNKYPGGRVEFTESKLSVYNFAGFLCVAIILAGNGMIKDIGDEVGAKDKHDMSPIPRNTRVHKLFVDGKMGLDEEAAARRLESSKLAVDGKILSIEEYKAKGFDVDREGHVETPEAPATTIAQA